MFYELITNPMNLSPIKLKCMEYSDKTLSKNCIFKYSETWEYCYMLWFIIEHDRLQYYNSFIDWELLSLSSNYMEVIWHPITWWYLCYLASINNKEQPIFEDYPQTFPDIFNQSILDRSDEFCEQYVLPFLQSINDLK